MRSLYHITLETGDVAMIPPDHVKAHARPYFEGLLQELATKREAALPASLGQWRVTAGQEPGRCMSAQVRTQIGDGWVPIAWLGIARHSRCGAQVWRAMHQLNDGNELATNPQRQPATPWLATRFLPGVIMLPEAARREIGWLADFAECLAWVWIESGVRDQADEND